MAAHCRCTEVRGGEHGRVRETYHAPASAVDGHLPVARPECTLTQRVLSILNMSAGDLTPYLASALSTVAILRIEPFSPFKFQFLGEPTELGFSPA